MSDDMADWSDILDVMTAEYHSPMLQEVPMPPPYDPGLPDWKAFVAQMREAPDDDHARVIFADWLDDTYGSCDLGAFIRTSVQVYQAYGRPAVLNGQGLWPTIWHHEFPGQGQFDLMYRCRKAFEATWRTWHILFAGLPLSLSSRWEFFRGFPRQVVCDFHHWDRWGDMICSLGPVGEVVLTTSPPVRGVTGESLHTFTLTSRHKVSSRAYKASLVVSRKDWTSRTGGDRRNGAVIHARLLEQIWPQPMVESFRIDPGPVTSAT